MSRRPQQMNLIKLIHAGQNYMQICPKDKRLSTAFPEINIIRLTQYAIRFMPPLAIAIFVWQYYMHAKLVLCIITALFALSLPVQGLLWLGKRAKSALPLNLLDWFNQLRARLITDNIIINKPIESTFSELMRLLDLTQKHIGDYLDIDHDHRHGEEGQ
jgi:uncharacterized protein